MTSYNQDLQSQQPSIHVPPTSSPSTHSTSSSSLAFIHVHHSSSSISAVVDDDDDEEHSHANNNTDNDEEHMQQVGLKISTPDDVEVVGLLKWEREPQGRSHGADGSVNAVRRKDSVGSDDNSNTQSGSTTQPDPFRPQSLSTTQPRHIHPPSNLTTTQPLRPRPRPRSGSHSRGLGMGMQSTPPGSIVLARNRSRSFGYDVAGLGGDVRGGDDGKKSGFGFGILPTRTSTPIQQQRKRLSLKLSRSYKTMTTQQYSTGGLPIQDDSHSSTEGDEQFDWDGEEMDIELPSGFGMGIEVDDGDIRRNEAVISDYSPPSVLRDTGIPADAAPSQGRSVREGGSLNRRPTSTTKRQGRDSDDQTGTTRSTVPTRVQSFVVPLNDADDGYHQVEFRDEKFPRPQDGMDTSNRTTQPPGTTNSSPLSGTNPTFHRGTNIRLRTTLPLPLSVSNHNNPPVTPPAQRASATVRRRDSSSSQIANVNVKERRKIIDPRSQLAPSERMRSNELINSEQMTDGDSFDEIPKMKEAKVPPGQSGEFFVPRSSERYGLGTFDETDDEKESTTRTPTQRNNDQDEDDGDNETLEQPRGRAENQQRNEMPFSPGRYHDQQDLDDNESNDLQDLLSNDDNIDGTPVSTTRTRTTDDKGSKHSNNSPLRPTAGATTSAHQRRPLSHLPALFNLPPPSPLSFSMTADITPTISPTSFRRLWKDTYPDVVIPREIGMDRVPGKGERWRKRRGRDAMTGHDDEGSDQDQRVEKRAVQKEKRARDDQEEMNSDDERRAEDRKRRIAFFKDLDENYKLVVEWVI